IVTLSVSSSTSGSSTATRSPGCLNHLPMVASVTDSPSVGTRISVMIFVLVTRARQAFGVMPAHSAFEDARKRAYVAGIHVFLAPFKARRGWPGQARP